MKKLFNKIDYWLENDTGFPFPLLQLFFMGATFLLIVGAILVFFTILFQLCNLLWLFN